MCRVLTTTVMFHKNNRKVCQEYWVSGSTSIVQTESHSPFETRKQQSPTPALRSRAIQYSRVLCFTKEISPSISTRPRL